jgi:DNA-binding NtrC family response regulator
MENDNSILIVDDNRFISADLSKMFIRKGWVVYLAKNSEQAIEIMNNCHIDAVLMDAYTDRIDGLEAITSVRDTNSDTPIIIMTGDDNLELERTARSQGIFAYLAKPLENELVERTVIAAIYSKEKKH